MDVYCTPLAKQASLLLPADALCAMQPKNDALGLRFGATRQEYRDRQLEVAEYATQSEKR